MDEILSPGDRCRVLGVIRGTVVLRQYVGGVYSYLIDVDNGARGEYPASCVDQIGKAAPEPCESERAVDRAWADHDEGDRIARERASYLVLGEPDEIEGPDNSLGWVDWLG